jgi:uncharacterized protein (TIGR04255 family)
MKLPHKLNKVPIVEAVFEIRYAAEMATSSVLPGLLFTQLPGKKIFQKQAAADLPEAFRQADPQLKYAPISGFQWADKFLVLISDRSFGLACMAPYPGWSEFREAILKVVEVVIGADMLSQVERCSLKYINIIPPAIGNAFETFEFELRVGEKIVKDGHFQIRSEITEGPLLHIVQIVSEGAIQAQGRVHSGAVIDVDTVRSLGKVSPKDFIATLAEDLDKHHVSTKRMFFSCLKQNALEKLEPVYE